MNATKQQIDAIFFTALNLPDDGPRGSFLDRACAGDGPLRAAVEKLLSAHAATEDFFAGDTSALRLTAEDFQAAAGEHVIEECASLDEGAGTRIGRYKLLERIGEGGWGVVYMAEQEKPIRRRVAVKIIKLGMDTKSVIARFQAECQALAMMDHPGIARVLDAGATQSGRPYFVMELVSGVKITDFCDENNLDTRERLALFVQICHAVQHAHQKGLIHRDLKPSNILVTLHDGVPAPKVIDFGIAKAIEGRLTEKTLLTPHQQTVGTPAYMSPEQADFSRMDVDTRSDIYSLGVLLYELLTGRTPFDPKELMQFGPEGICRALREKEPPRPSAMLATQAKPDLEALAHRCHAEPPQLISLLEGDLDWVVMKAMEKDRNRRYETANGLAMDLERYLNNEPVLARPPSSFYRFQKLVRRNKVVFVAGTLVVMALVIGLGAATWLFVLEREARHEQARLRLEAESARASESRLRVRAEARERLARMAALLSQTNYNAADALLAQTPLDVIEPSTESLSVLQNLGEWYAVSGRWRQAADCFTALIRVNRLKPSKAATIGMDLLFAGSALLECGDVAGYQLFRQDALDHFDNRTDVAEQVLKACLLVPADESVFNRLKPLAQVTQQASAKGGLAWCALALELMEYRQNHFTNALEWGQKAVNAADPNPARIAAAHSVLAMSQHQLGQSEQALAELALARTMVEARFAQPLQRMTQSSEGSWCAWVIARRLMLEAANLMEDRLEPDGAQPGVIQPQ